MEAVKLYTEVHHKFPSVNRFLRKGCVDCERAFGSLGVFYLSECLVLNKMNQKMPEFETRRYPRQLIRAIAVSVDDLDQKLEEYIYIKIQPYGYSLTQNYY
ncbi:hypothetical protein H6P81_000932 [Aristolochia fimbriata]|uniref:Uncharacterized protein n=1 Tax=Aristolochia fimbriata TaxID=158543 RepID=A0AAV7F6Y9_ARIFI|nr:hypothetical protein H6P81_000932 [Aristolochia fimbriata]